MIIKALEESDIDPRAFEKYLRRKYNASLSGL